MEKEGMRRLYVMSEKEMIEEGIIDYQEDREQYDNALNTIRGAIDNSTEINWEKIVLSIDLHHWADESFVLTIINEYAQSDIYLEQLYGLLPPVIRESITVQKAFFSSPYADIRRIPATALESCDSHLLLNEWFAPGRRVTFREFPWNVFSREEQRNIILKAIHRTNTFNEYSNLIAELKSDKQVQDAFGNEWNQLVKEGYEQNEQLFAYEITNYNYKVLADFFTPHEIQELVKQMRDDKGESFLHQLTLAQLKFFEFSEKDCNTYKKEFTNRVHGLTDGFKYYADLDDEDREWLFSSMDQRTESYHEDTKEFLVSKLPDLMKRVPPESGNEVLYLVEAFLRKYEEGMSPIELPPGITANIILKGVLEAQPVVAKEILSRLLEQVDLFHSEDKLLINLMCPDEESAKILRQVMVDTGAKFYDFFSFYLGTHFVQYDHSNELHRFSVALSKEPYIVDFIGSKLPWVPSVWRSFSDRVKNGEDVNSVVAELAGNMQEKMDAIHTGDWDDAFLEEEGVGLITHVFPPAIGVSREEYRRLLERREVRQEDIPEEWNHLQAETVSFSIGKWEIKHGETFSTTPWERISKIMYDVNNKKIVEGGEEHSQEERILMGPAQIVELGKKYIHLARKKDGRLQDELLRSSYALHLKREGARFYPTPAQRESAVELFEWANDGLRDTIDVALQAYSTFDHNGYVQEINQVFKKEISKKARKAAIGALLGILRTHMDQGEKTKRIKGVFARFDASCSHETVYTLWEYAEDISDMGELTKKVGDLFNEQISTSEKEISSEAGKLSSIIAQKIIGADGPAMQSELKKWQFNEDAEGGKTRDISFHISKERAHCVAGLNMGVCVAVDNRLWEKEDFSNVIMFADDGIARGGMHFEIIYDEEHRYLSLPGLNPSLSLLREIKPEKIFDAMIDFAKKCAKEIGATAILIPEKKFIHSNRSEFQTVIASRDMPVHALSRTHQFSYDPFPYSWNSAFRIDV